MTPIYQAASSLDAQLVLDLLEDAEIAARLSAPDAAGHVEVLVDEEVADAARALVRHLESGTDEIDDDADDEGFATVALDEDDEDLLLDSTPLRDDD